MVASVFFLLFIYVKKNTKVDDIIRNIHPIITALVVTILNSVGF